MLTSAKLVGFVPTRDLQRAKEFFTGTLRLPVTLEDAFSAPLHANGMMIRVAKVGNYQPAPFTILGWEVKDIRLELRELQQRGVRFERFEGMKQDGDGVWTAPGGAQVAWFKDADGNVLSISQFA